MADEEQVVDEGVAGPLKVDPNLVYEVRYFCRPNGQEIEQLTPREEGKAGSGRVRYRGHAPLLAGDSGRQVGTLHFEIRADTPEEAWERFGVRAGEELEKEKAKAKTEAVRAQLLGSPKIDEFRRQRMGRRLGGGRGGNGGGR